MSLDLTKEKYGEVAAVGDGIWVIASQHHPGMNTSMPVVNNRLWVVRVTDKGEQYLIGLGVPEPRPHVLEGVASLEKETGLPLKFLVVQSGLHIMFSSDWLDARPDIVAYYPPARVPFTASGKKCLEKHAGRYLSLDLQPLADITEVQYRVLDGLLIHPDLPTPKEGGKDGFFALIKNFRQISNYSTEHDEIHFYLPAVKTMIYGDNMMWYFREGCPFKFKAGGMGNDLVKVQTQGMKVGDAEKVAENWRAIFSWDFTDATGFHEWPTTKIERADVKGDLRVAVERSGQLGSVPKTSSSCVIM